MEKYGRRLTVLIACTLFIIGAVLTACGVFSLLFIGRLISGIALGISSTVVPVLLSEIATVGTRGSITATHPVMIASGILVASLVAFGFVEHVNGGWRYVQGLAAAPATIALGSVYALSMLLYRTDSSLPPSHC